MNEYEVRNEMNQNLGNDILMMFYGNLWKSALDRISHRSDGHLFTICHNGEKLKIYRISRN